ncbi:MAG: GDP-mannose 4,6-dehydratase, partial [Candidatus Zixiibacteriota bacterium]
LDARRDWGFAGDYVEAMWSMLQLNEPENFVIATGETHSVEEFVSAAFERVDLDYHDYVVTDPRFMRPAEVDLLQGDPAYAKKKLGWEPRVSFGELVNMMVDADIQRLSSSAG